MIAQNLCSIPVFVIFFSLNKILDECHTEPVAGSANLSHEVPTSSADNAYADNIQKINCETKSILVSDSDDESIVEVKMERETSGEMNVLKKADVAVRNGRSREKTSQKFAKRTSEPQTKRIKRPVGRPKASMEEKHCAICELEFPHNDEAAFKCNVCNLPFFTRNGLFKHNRTKNCFNV